MHTGPSSRLDEAFDLLASVVDEMYRRGAKTLVAGVKPDLQRRSLGGFDEQSLGFETFSQFAKAAAATGRLTIRTADDGFLELLPLAASSVSPVTRTGTAHAAKAGIRKDLWSAFTDWRTGLRRVYDSELDRAVIFPDEPAPLEPEEVSRQRLAWRAHPDRFIEIQPIPMDVHIGWMRRFAAGVLDTAQRQVLEVALDSDRPAAAFARAVRTDIALARQWHNERQGLVGERIEEWRSRNELSDLRILEQRSASRNVVAVPRSATQLELESVRSRLHGAIDKMPLHELLRIAVPIEYVLGT